MEEWFTTYEFEGITYFVSTKGRIFGPRKELKQRLNEDGYLTVTMGGFHRKRTTMRVHSIVMRAFVGCPCDGYEVNHIDFNRTNSDINNLEYITHLDNIHYSYDFGRYKGKFKGENNPRSKINYAIANEIRKKYKNGMKIATIAKEYKLGWTTVSHIINNDTWVN